MLRSLLRHAPSARVYVFAFDEGAGRALRTLAIPGVTVVALAEFEDEELLAAKATRGRVEYCWTCTPSVIRHVLLARGESACTYLDADLLFFANPAPLLAEIGNRSVIITSHRYTPEFDQSSMVGKFNVQFVTFRKTDPGLVVLEEWRRLCLEACEINPAKGLCGDQKYLDDWPERYPETVHVLEHEGGGVAPWNMQQYKFRSVEGRVMGRTLATGSTFPVVFFHFHGLARERHVFHAWRHRLFSIRRSFRLSAYPMGAGAKDHLYGPYMAELTRAAKDVAPLVDIDPIGERNVDRRLDRLVARLRPERLLARFRRDK